MKADYCDGMERSGLYENYHNDWTSVRKRRTSIGKILADDLGIKYYDKELLERAAKDSGLCQELFENHDEKPTNSFLYSLVMDSYSFGYGSTMMDMPLNQKVFLAQFDAIKKISQERSVCHRRPLCRLCTGGKSERAEHLY